MDNDRDKQLFTPWLCTTPDQLLDEFNITQRQRGDTIYDTLAIRVYIFYKDAILLELETNARGWAVPTLQCKVSLPPCTDASSTRNPAIMTRVIEHLKHADVPRTLLHDLQFMEFSHDEPLTIPPTPHTKTNHKVIAVVLMTSNPASDQGFLPREKVLVPKDTKFRWVPVTESRLILVPFCTQYIDPSLDFSFQHILDARQRLATCSRQAMGAPVGGKKTWGLCASILSGILFTRRLVSGKQDLGSGVIAVTPDTETPYVVLIEGPMTVGEYVARLSMLEEISHDGKKLIVVGKWNDHNLEGLSNWPGWSLCLDSSGRLREGSGRDED